MDGVSEMQESQSPLISVVIPSYNRAALLPRAITSVLTQTFSNLECIVVDDGSTDHTEQVLAGFPDPRLRVVRLPGNGGYSRANNTGIQVARGELIAFLDSDDEWRPEKLECQVARLREYGDPMATVVYCRCMVRDALSGRMWRRPHRIYEGDVFPYLLEGWHPTTPSLFLVDRRSLLKVGGFSETLPSAQDYDLWLRLAEASFRFVATDEVLVVKHEYSDDQMSDDPTTPVRTGEILDHRWGPVIRRHLGWVGYRRWRKRRWDVVQWAHFRRIKIAIAHGQRLEAWRTWVGMCRLLSHSIQYVCSAFLMIVLGFRAYCLLVHAVEAVRRSVRRSQDMAGA
ncbi:MAG TPA: glycosyltransferase [Verrucomicrobiae bacterium]|nr:glycosyltransferase [Verrucomicrobiae bacterium]